jgi:hypothetical protein
MPKFNAKNYPEWKYWVHLLLSERGFRGWPESEMRKYFEAGYVPSSACELYARRRMRLHNVKGEALPTTDKETKR